MSNIKNELKELVENLVIPEVDDYLEELHTSLNDEEKKEENLEIIREMESFLVELYNILEVIKEDSMPDSEYERIYNQLMKHVKEHES